MGREPATICSGSKDNVEIAIQSWVNYDNSWYWVNAQGAMVTDLLDSDYKQLEYYVGQDGKMLADTWFEYNHRTYYLTESGAAAKGWVDWMASGIISTEIMEI